MDYFESILATLLESENFWVRRSFKVELTKEEKCRVGKPSMPRPEIDLLALNFKSNEIVLMEAKSYFDSPGIALPELKKNHKKPEGRYKLFTCQILREIVMFRIKEQLRAQGMANEATKLQLGLAAGKVRNNASDEIRQFIESRGWIFWSPDQIRNKVENLANRGYENDPAIITAKILMR